MAAARGVPEGKEAEPLLGGDPGLHVISAAAKRAALLTESQDVQERRAVDELVSDLGRELTTAEIYFVGQVSYNIRGIFDACIEAKNESIFLTSLKSLIETSALGAVTYFAGRALSADKSLAIKVAAGTSAVYGAFQVWKIKKHADAKLRAQRALSILHPTGTSPSDVELKRIAYIESLNVAGRLLHRFQRNIKKMRSNERGVGTFVDVLTRSIAESIMFESGMTSKPSTQAEQILLEAAIPTVGSHHFKAGLGRLIRLETIDGKTNWTAEGVIWRAPVETPEGIILYRPEITGCCGKPVDRSDKYQHQIMPALAARLLGWEGPHGKTTARTATPFLAAAARDDDGPMDAIDGLEIPGQDGLAQ